MLLLIVESPRQRPFITKYFFLHRETKDIAINKFKGKGKNATWPSLKDQRTRSKIFEHSLETEKGVRKSERPFSTKIDYFWQFLQY